MEKLNMEPYGVSESNNNYSLNATTQKHILHNETKIILNNKGKPTGFIDNKGKFINFVFTGGKGSISIKKAKALVDEHLANEGLQEQVDVISDKRDPFSNIFKKIKKGIKNLDSYKMPKLFNKLANIKNKFIHSKKDIYHTTEDSDTGHATLSVSDNDYETQAVEPNKTKFAKIRKNIPLTPTHIKIEESEPFEAYNPAFATYLESSQPSSIDLPVTHREPISFESFKTPENPELPEGFITRRSNLSKTRKSNDTETTIRPTKRRAPLPPSSEDSESLEAPKFEIRRRPLMPRKRYDNKMYDFDE